MRGAKALGPQSQLFKRRSGNYINQLKKNNISRTILSLIQKTHPRHPDFGSQDFIQPIG
ncbi:MAG: hypothetical protein ACJARR_001904 [Pseudophaeobacter arcticus]|jgi:hypothetical protein